MNKTNAYSTFLLNLMLVLFVTSTSYLESANAAFDSENKVVKNKYEDKEQRLAQAKELLGSHYKRSVVRFGEKVPRVKDYLTKQVQAGLPKSFKKKALQMTKCILAESKKYGFDPLFVLAVMTNESHLDPKTLGQFGEIGLMQIKPETAKWIAKKYDLKWEGPDSLFSIKTNIKIGAAYLDYLRDTFDNHGRLYLSAYNMGPANVRSALRRDIWPKDYVIRVMDYYVKFYADLTDHPNRKPATKLESKSVQKLTAN